MYTTPSSRSVTSPTRSRHEPSDPTKFVGMNVRRRQARDVDEEVPMWIERDEEAAKAVREGSKSDVETEEQTKKSMFVAPEVPPGQGTLGEDDSSLRVDQHRAISPLSSDNIDPSTLQRLRDANIVQLPDGTGRWMKVDERPDGSINMTPVDIEAFLRSRPVDEGEMPDMSEISER